MPYSVGVLLGSGVSFVEEGVDVLVALRRCGVTVGVEEGSGVLVGVEVGNGVLVGVDVGVGVGVLVGVGVGVGVFVGVGVGVGTCRFTRVFNSA